MKQGAHDWYTKVKKFFTKLGYSVLVTDEAIFYNIKKMIWVKKSETHGTKYNLVANVFISWVSFLKRILSITFCGNPSCVGEVVTSTVESREI